ncbi:MAG: Asp-tRNA(Asn)/Glu-tRNA(Gln) amidotransferase subunit GatB [Candidatus Omnitrophica bacterium]|nr:Asp-tRNA(Asn)/Glu-tRNA(Gln) amidotransferase subunit GatB [Candidatus Omnitrophota bacterium]
MGDLETVIGLEVHTQLKTESKIFCSCSTNFESPANSNICPVCCGYPGVLPVFNQKALELAVRVCCALDCKVNSSIYFERKNYFYPDLPKDYQISQYKMPLGEAGSLELISGRKIRVNRVHLEEDAGKLIHKQDHSLVDFNRTGTPLLEIVSEPDISGPDEAFEYLSHLKLMLQYIGVSDCDMEKGSLRCDANISLRKKGDKKLGVKVELKNMNSFKGVKAGLEYEVKRQAAALVKGEKVIQETRLWDELKLKTIVMRSKEQAHDYRYFPEPDLLDFSVAKDLIKNQQLALGELPLAKRKRFLKDYSLEEKEVDIIINQAKLADLFEDTVKIYPESREVFNWLLGPFLEQVNSLKDGFNEVLISAANFAKIIRYFSEGKMNNLAAKKALSLSIATDRDVDEIINSEQLVQVSDSAELDKYIEETVVENQKVVDEYLAGKQQAIQFLVGQVMKKTKGKANPKVAREMLERRLSR